MVVSYASSPAAEVLFADPPLTTAPTASIVSAGMCYRQIEFIGILAGTPQRALAEAFVDFMLSKEVQEDIPLQMFVYPVDPAARLPESFILWNQVVEEPASLDPAVIAAGRDQWIAEWTEMVLR
jgi:thiamine transport system substrate-binding protein